MSLELERTGPTVSAAVIDEFERRVGATLPQEYWQFLLTVNGGWATTDFHHPRQPTVTSGSAHCGP